jgi:tetratricopeptide (TPR) repeat protein
MFKKAEDLFAGNPDLKHFFFISASGGDKEAIRTATKDFAALLEKKSPKGIERHYLFLEKEDHGSVVHRVIYSALEALYSGWRIEYKTLETIPLNEIRDHYRKLSEKFGYQIPIPEGTINFKAFLLYRAKKYDESVETAKFNVANYPESAGTHLNLGRAYNAAGKPDLAVKSYETALKLAEKNNDAKLPIIKKELSRLLEEMKSKGKEKTKTD